MTVKVCVRRLRAYKPYQMYTRYQMHISQYLHTIGSGQACSKNDSWLLFTAEMSIASGTVIFSTTRQKRCCHSAEHELSVYSNVGRGGKRDCACGGLQQPLPMATLVEKLVRRTGCVQRPARRAGAVNRFGRQGVKTSPMTYGVVNHTIHHFREDCKPQTELEITQTLKAGVNPRHAYTRAERVATKVLKSPGQP